MTDVMTLDTYGTLTEPNTVRLSRLLPGPIERVWAYLTESELRRRWLAAGEMTLEVGAPFEFVWRNDELTDPPGSGPSEYAGEHRMTSQITELDPPRKLAFSWNRSGDVTIELTPQAGGTLLTLTHRRLADRDQLLGVSAGWHAHIDVLEARIGGARPAPFWDGWARLRADYAARIPS